MTLNQWRGIGGGVALMSAMAKANRHRRWRIWLAAYRHLA
jgi:hypothetical protein